MPRPHTAHERTAIRERLLACGRDLFVRLGLQKTTVSDLAGGAGIGKGSFYQFFDSKEALFLAIQEREEALFRDELIADVDGSGSAREAVVVLFGRVASRLDRHPFLRALLDPDVVRGLALRLPSTELDDHQQRDRDFFVELARRWKQRGWLRDSVDPQQFFDVLAAMFILSLERDRIGRETSEGAAMEIALALADRWCVPGCVPGS